MMKAQLEKSKSRAQEIENQLNKSNKGTLLVSLLFKIIILTSSTETDDLKVEKSVQEKKNETLTKVITPFCPRSQML